MEIKNVDSTKILILVFIFSAGSLVIAAVGLFVGWDSDSINIGEVKRVASELLDKKFYLPAAGMYEKALAVGRLSAPEEARLHYLAGELYLSNIGDYETASAHLLASRALDPHPDYEKERAEKIVFALERSGRSDLAKKESKPSSGAQPPDTGIVAATIGERKITKAELEREFAATPPEIQAAYAGPDGIKKFLEQYVGVELIYQSALRRGFDKEPNFPEVVARARKEALVQRALDEDINRGIRLTPAEVSRFYEENKTMFGGRPLAEVSRQAAYFLRQKKEQEGYKQLVLRLGKAEKVQFFPARLQ